MSTISYDHRSMIIDGKHTVLIGGELQYFRIPRALWEKRVRMLSQSGCNCLATYVPWNWHEQKEGEVIWDGEQDLKYFLDLCLKYNMYVIIKPGPYICAEWDFGGFPDWLLTRDMKFRTDVPEYMELTRKWYQEVVNVIKPYLITNGGNILMIQVENEYDHLISMEPDVYGTPEQGKQYILKLLAMLRDMGIDIPAYINDGTCVYGSEIINTNTYYPDMPWYKHDAFDFTEHRIISNREGQPDKPLGVIEIQNGWFTIFGKPTPIYELKPATFELITKTLIVNGVSIYNYYMGVGCTNFPYWGTCGDHGATGVCTTYDFGGAFIREWGESTERYNVVRNWAYFLDSFRQVITEGQMDNEAAGITTGSEEYICLYKDKSSVSEGYKDSAQNVAHFFRRGPEASVFFFRNAISDSQQISIEIDSAMLGKKIKIPTTGKLDVHYSQSLLLPVDFKLSDDISIVHSTSELIFRKQLGEKEYIFLKGLKNLQGEMRLTIEDEVIGLTDNVKVCELDGTTLVEYDHSMRTGFDIGNKRFIVLPEKEATKVWQQQDTILVTDAYYLDKLEQDDSGIEMNIQVQQGTNKVSIWTVGDAGDVSVNGIDVQLTRDEVLGCSDFEIKAEMECGSKLEFSGNWKYTGDLAEAADELDTSNWDDITADMPLERAGYCDHGYFWYRSEFELPEGELDDVRLDIQVNGMDRYVFFINGRQLVTDRSGGEVRISDWVRNGKNSIAVLYANEFHTKAHPVDGAVIKVSGLYKPVEIWGIIGGKDYRYRIPDWKLRPGLGGDLKKYYAKDYNDSSWVEAPRGKSYIINKEVGSLVWLRRNFSYNKDENFEAPVYLELKDMSERCLIYVNGTAIGRHENIGPQFKYFIPENILKDENQLTIMLQGPGPEHNARKVLPVPVASFEEPGFGLYFQAKPVEVKVSVKHALLV